MMLTPTLKKAFTKVDAFFMRNRKKSRDQPGLQIDR